MSGSVILTVSERDEDGVSLRVKMTLRSGSKTWSVAKFTSEPGRVSGNRGTRWLCENQNKNQRSGREVWNQVVGGERRVTECWLSTSTPEAGGASDEQQNCQERHQGSPWATVKSWQDFLQSCARRTVGLNIRDLPSFHRLSARRLAIWMDVLVLEVFTGQHSVTRC